MIRLLLLVAGVVAGVVGAWLLFDPIGFRASVGIELERSANVLSETRASGAPLLAGGLLIVAGAVRASLRRTGALLASLLFLSYGAGRVLSVVFDGPPPASIVVAGAVELAIGLLCALSLRALLRAK